jgi:hypothetical protein
MNIFINGEDIYDRAERATTKACKGIEDFKSITYLDVYFSEGNVASVKLSVLYKAGQRVEVTKVVSV